MFERQFTSNSTPQQPSTFITGHWCYIQSSNFNLNANIGEFFSFGNTSSGTINTRKNVVVINQTLRTFMVNLNTGTHDAEMTITLGIDATPTTRIITIPASAGAAIYTQEGSTLLNALSFFAYEIEGGGGAGNSAIMSWSQDVA